MKPCQHYPHRNFTKVMQLEKAFRNEESTAIDNKSCRPENELEQTTKVLEPREYIPGEIFEGKTQSEAEMQLEHEHNISVPQNAHEISVADGCTINVPGTIGVFINQIGDVNSTEERKSENSENLATPNEDVSSQTNIDASEGLHRDKSKKTLSRTSFPMPQGVKKEVKAEIFNKDDVKNIFGRNDVRTTEPFRVNTSFDTIDTDDKHEESSKSQKSNNTRGSEDIEEQTIDSENTLVEVQISYPRDETVNQVKDHNIKDFKSIDSNEQRVIMDLSFEDDPTKKEAASRDSDEAIEPAATRKPATQEGETPQIDSAKENEVREGFEQISPSSSSAVMIKSSHDTGVKVSRKKSHGILSGVGSKVKHSISKVKKAITGKSSHRKTPSPK